MSSMTEGAMRVLGWIVAVMLALLPGLAGADEPTVAYVLSGHERPVWSAAFSPDGRFIVTGSRDKTARVWDAASGQELYRLGGHGSDVTSAAFSPDGRFIVTGSHDKAARVWALP